MRAYAVQYKDQQGFTHFVPTENGQLPVFSSIARAQALLDTLVEINQFRVRGTPIYGRKHLFGTSKLMGYNKPDDIIMKECRQLLNTIHIGIINVAPTQNKV